MSEKISTDRKDPELIDYQELLIKGEGIWTIADKIIACSQGEGYIFTNRKYDYFHLKVEFLADELVNSGIFFGCISEEQSPVSCFEANIWDEHPNQKFRTGSLVTRQSPLETVHTIDEWSTFEIIAEKGRVQIWVNNTRTADLKTENLPSSPIFFQKFGQGSIKFRNIRIATLTM